jgi:hypothetical protein
MTGLPERCVIMDNSKDMQDLQKQIEREMNALNHRGIADFEGYSAIEMDRLLYDTFGEGSPIELQRSDDDVYAKIPLLNLVRHAAEIISRNGGLKTTTKGNFPRKVVMELYEQGLLKSEYVDDGTVRLSSEEDLTWLHLTRLLMELAKLTNKRGGKLSLTKAAEQNLADNHELLSSLMKAYMTMYNWAYFDNYVGEDSGRIGCGFSLVLVSKYGAEWRQDSFYAKKYYTAFPMLVHDVTEGFLSRERNALGSYSSRTFDHFMRYFGLVTISTEGAFPVRVTSVMKTDIFDALIHCRPPGWKQG